MAAYQKIDEDMELMKIALDIDNGRCTGYQAVERFKKLQKSREVRMGGSISTVPCKPLTGNTSPFTGTTYTS